jgi:hypothetical protein
MLNSIPMLLNCAIASVIGASKQSLRLILIPSRR